MPNQKIAVQAAAPDFSLRDTRDQEIRLADFLDRGPVVLVLMRGFA